MDAQSAQKTEFKIWCRLQKGTTSDQEMEMEKRYSN